MSVLVVGMSHRSAPVSLLEQLSMGGDTKARAAEGLLDSPSLTEAMILSTCNRFEVYAVTTGFHNGVRDVVNVLHQVSGVDIETLRNHLYVRYGDAAAEHMMTVTSGLDSMVTGEQQIIGQMRTAYQEAADQGTVGGRLHALAQAALHTGKRVHAETEIDAAGASMVTFALDSALRRLPRRTPGGPASDQGARSQGSTDRPLTGRRALVLGAGAMASLAATYLGKLGADHLVIANRTQARAERLAEHSRQAGVEASAVPFAERATVLPGVDIVVSATGSGSFAITREDVAAVSGADQPELVLVDLSLPRDIDPEVTAVGGVSLINIEALRLARESEDAAPAIDGVAAARRDAKNIVATEVRTFSSQQRVRDVVPAVAALRRHADELVDGELKRLKRRAPSLDDAEFQAAQQALRRVVDKLLHHPTVRVKQLAMESGTVSYDTALQDLFGLDYADDQDRSVAVSATALPAGDFQDHGRTNHEAGDAKEIA